MAKNNYCRICGKNDFEDKGKSLICRVCGEEKKKYVFSKLQFFSIPLLVLLGIISEIIASMIGVYKADVYSPSFRRNSLLQWLHYKCYNYSLSNRIGYNELDLLMVDLREHLVWLEPLFRILGISLFALAIFFIVTVYRNFKKLSVTRGLEGENYGKE